MFLRTIASLLLLVTCSYGLSADYDYTGIQGEQFLGVKVNGTATIKLPVKAKYERYTINPATKQNELQVYTVCNGKNKAKCGFWMNKKNKKKVVSGATTYNKSKKALIIKNFKKSDAGDYKGGSSVVSVFIQQKSG